jgi:hypothetical protein
MAGLTLYQYPGEKYQHEGCEARRIRLNQQTWPCVCKEASIAVVAAAVSSVDKLEKSRGMVMVVMEDKEELPD